MYLLLREAMSIVGLASRGPLPSSDSEQKNLDVSCIDSADGSELIMGTSS